MVNKIESLEKEIAKSDIALDKSKILSPALTYILPSMIYTAKESKLYRGYTWCKDC